ncbi:RICIN domain-containing protein [Longispora albida]|uniref:RICIN domain-containing protein n=1 Tax=Longispora albida TaxID=203523 RepID=UPI000374DEBB|nr:ricin-type beta-trefoil lectin domain protein [Longispora albida]
MFAYRALAVVCGVSAAGFAVPAAAAIPDNSFTVRNMDSALCLEYAPDQKATVLTPCEQGNRRQLWQLVEQGDSVALAGATRNICVTGYDGENRIGTHKCDNRDGQTWTAIVDESGHYMLQNDLTTQCLATTIGGTVTATPCNGSSTSRWQLTPVN